MQRENNADGFSLIEVLVVCSVIAILAAIALPSFLGQTNKAQDSEAKAALSTAAVAMESLFVDRETYGVTEADLQAAEPALTSADGLSVSGDAKTFVVSVNSTSGGTFLLSRLANGQTERSCTTPGVGGCKPAGIW